MQTVDLLYQDMPKCCITCRICQQSVAMAEALMSGSDAINRPNAGLISKFTQIIQANAFWMQ